MNLNDKIKFTLEYALESISNSTTGTYYTLRLTSCPHNKETTKYLIFREEELKKLIEKEK